MLPFLNITDSIDEFYSLVESDRTLTEVAVYTSLRTSEAIRKAVEDERNAPK